MPAFCWTRRREDAEENAEKNKTRKREQKKRESGGSGGRGSGDQAAAWRYAQRLGTYEFAVFRCEGGIAVLNLRDRGDALACLETAELRLTIFGEAEVDAPAIVQQEGKMNRIAAERFRHAFIAWAESRSTNPACNQTAT
jgi:hypothetical protein